MTQEPVICDMTQIGMSKNTKTLPVHFEVNTPPPPPPWRLVTPVFTSKCTGNNTRGLDQYYR